MYCAGLHDHHGAGGEADALEVHDMLAPTDGNHQYQAEVHALRRVGVRRRLAGEEVGELQQLHADG